MLNCPQCKRTYADGLSFCLDDGSALIPETRATASGPTERFPNNALADSYEPETQIRYAVAQKQGGSGFTVAVVATLFVVGVLVLLAAAGIAGFIYYSSSQSGENAELNETPTPYPTPSPTPFRLSEENDSEVKPESLKPEESLPDNKVKTDPKKVEPKEEAPELPINTTPKTTEETESKPEISDRRRIPKRISGGVLNGKAISLPKPAYPAAARAVRASGSVSVQVLVDTNGNVVSASAVSGHPLLRASAAAAARRATFQPTLLAGQPVNVTGVIVYNFVP